MKRRFLLSIVVATLMVSVVHAGLAPTNLPSSPYYQGRHDKTFNLESGDTVKVRLEFAVYQGEDAGIMRDITGYTGETTGYVYAYQIFSDSSSTAALTAFSLTGVNANAISSVTDDIGQAGSITYGQTYESDGVEPAAGYFNDSVDEAIWEFEDGALVQGESSWFLFLYSDYDWVKGDIAVETAVYDDDVPVPDGDGNGNIPEPATLLLLAGGALLSLKRK